MLDASPSAALKENCMALGQEEDAFAEPGKLFVRLGESFAEVRNGPDDVRVRLDELRRLVL